MQRAHFLLREAMFAAGSAASLAALLIWLGPPGNDLAAHVYQRTVFLHDGSSLEQLLVRRPLQLRHLQRPLLPLAGVGIKPLAIASIATAALAFAVVVCRQWGPLARWSSRTFGVVWAGLVISAAFPFALGIALGLLAIWALQAGKRWRFGILAVLTAAASPLAFLLLAIFLAGIGLGMRERGRHLLAPTLIVAAVGASQFLLARAFADGGRYPFSMFELGSIMLFCTLGALLTWHVEGARMIRWFFVAYAAASVVAFAVASPLGENIARVRFAALPIAVLVLSLRSWRHCRSPPSHSCSQPPGTSARTHGASRASVEPSAHAEYWQPAIDFLRENLTPSYRVEAVDTSGHWAAVYLPRADIPLTRGWFRQDDFQNEVLYELDGATYLRWLRLLGVRYVVLTDAPPTTARRGGSSDPQPSLRARARVARPAPDDLLGPASAPARDRIRPGRGARARSDVHAPSRRSAWTLPARRALLAVLESHRRLPLPREGRDDPAPVAPPGLLLLRFKVDTGRALATMVGSGPAECPRPSPSYSCRKAGGSSGSGSRRPGSRLAAADSRDPGRDDRDPHLSRQPLVDRRAEDDVRVVA